MRIPLDYYMACFPRSRDTMQKEAGLLGAAAVLGTGYLANQGLNHLLNLKVPGGFQDTYEKALLAQHNDDMFQRLGVAEDSLSSSKRMNRYLGAGLAGALALMAAPKLLEAYQASRFELPPEAPAQLPDKRRRSQVPETLYD